MVQMLRREAKLMNRADTAELQTDDNTARTVDTAKVYTLCPLTRSHETPWIKFCTYLISSRLLECAKTNK